MAAVHFMIQDDEGGQSVTCEARASDPTNPESMANIIATYIADNWVGLVMAARLAHKTAVLNEAKSIQVEDQLTRVEPRLVDAAGLALEPVDPSKMGKLQ